MLFLIVLNISINIELKDLNEYIFSYELRLPAVNIV
jgi:hypothetical protein